MFISDEELEKYLRNFLKKLQGVEGRFDIYNQVERESRTVYVDPITGDDNNGNGSASAPFATIQKAIASIKRIIPPNVSITIQLGPNDGSTTRTFALTETVKIEGFTGGGFLIIKGDNVDETASSSKLIVVDGTGLNNHIFWLKLNNIQITIKAIKIVVDTSLGWWAGINVRGRSNWASIHYCAIEGKDNSQGYCIMAVHGAWIDVKNCYISNAKNGLFADFGSDIISRENYSYGTYPSNALSAWKQSRIAKVGNQPVGSANNEISGSGGEIE